MPAYTLPSATGDYTLSAAVLYADGTDKSWEDTLFALQQSTLMNLNVDAVDAAKNFRLSDYDIVFLPTGVCLLRNRMN